MTPTTAQIMTENTAGQTYRATYSPDDNKLRLYASLRLDEETYSLINKAGFRAQTGSFCGASLDAGAGGCPAFPRR